MNVSAEKKPRSRKARQILKYLNELKDSRNAISEICWGNANMAHCRNCAIRKYGVCPNNKGSLYGEWERGEDGRE